MHILIAEDQHVARVILATHLREWGYEVTETSNGIEALEYLVGNKLNIDMLITDWSMPQMDGIELARRVRALSESSQYIYTILLTGKGEFSDIVQGFAQGGVDDYIVKPFETNELHLRIQVGSRLIKAERAQRTYGEHLEAIVREQTKAIRETQNEIISRLFNALESYDVETGSHVRRIGLMSAYLARMLGLPSHKVDAIHAAAPMHDIGKIGVSDAVLLKPGPLSTDEFALVKQHTVIGGKILSGSQNPVIQLAEIIAFNHHENWDGSGYPHGLKGEAIPVEARIVSVVDVYDALRSDRVYRAGLSDEEVIKYMRSQSGKKFDPVVCDLFLEHLDEIHKLCERDELAEEVDVETLPEIKDFIRYYGSTKS